MIVVKQLLKNHKLKGQLLEPVYSRDLRRGLEPYGEEYFRTYVGQMPPNLANKSLEYNILFLNNNNLCRYQIIYNLESYPWDLLDMGMYLDSLTYNHKSYKTKRRLFTQN